MIVFLTGGSRGIGKHIKQIFESKGDKVICPSRETLDLSDISSVERYISNVDFIPDIVINNAGVNTVEEIKYFSRDTFIKMMDINFISHVLLTKEFLNRSICEDKKLNVVNIGSIRMEQLKRGRIHYTLSKICMDVFTKYLIHELGNSHLICNTVSPGYVATDMLVKNNNQQKVKSMLESVPLERFCNPEEIANVVYNLSVQNKYINGQNIIVDGGLTCR
jgi:NAD(P)-dependent dehydrogenase (short-subunit alcohol dehydrogenase family)